MRLTLKQYSLTSFVAYRPITKCLKVLYVHLFHHFQICDNQGRIFTEKHHTEHIPVLFVVFVYLHMKKTFMPYQIKHVADKWKRHWSRNLVTEDVLQGAKWCNPPEVNKQDYDCSDCNCPILRKDLFGQLKQIHILKE